MPRPLLPQQRFSVLVTKPGQNGQRYDITSDVDTVTLEIDQDRISVLTFNLRNPDKHSEYMDTGYHIDFYGGYVDSNAYSNKSQDNNGAFTYTNATNDRFRYMFNGRVFFIKLSYQNDGDTLQITCKDFSWGATCGKLSHYAYPSADSDRSIANAASIQLSDLVTFICTDIGIRVSLDIEVDPVYTLKRPAVQDGITDWAFLRKLAKANGCYIWTNIDPDTGEYTLYFTDRDKAVNTNNEKFEFVWLGREDDYTFENNAPYLTDGDDKTENSKLKRNQLKFESIDVEINPPIKFSFYYPTRQVP